MRSFADEKTGNAGITFNKTPKSLANRKRKISCLLLIVLAIIPTFIYVKVISNLECQKEILIWVVQ
jgi:hypothetical protein